MYKNNVRLIRLAATFCASAFVISGANANEIEEYNCAVAALDFIGVEQDKIWKSELDPAPNTVAGQRLQVDRNAYIQNIDVSTCSQSLREEYAEMDRLYRELDGVLSALENEPSNAAVQAYSNAGRAFSVAEQRFFDDLNAAASEKPAYSAAQEWLDGFERADKKGDAGASAIEIAEYNCAKAASDFIDAAEDKIVMSELDPEPHTLAGQRLLLDRASYLRDINVDTCSNNLRGAHGETVYLYEDAILALSMVETDQSSTNISLYNFAIGEYVEANSRLLDVIDADLRVNPHPE